MQERESPKGSNVIIWLMIVSSLQEVFGGNAVSDEYHIGRHVANLFVTQTYEGQSDIHSERTTHSRMSELQTDSLPRPDTRTSYHRYSSVCMMDLLKLSRPLCP